MTAMTKLIPHPISSFIFLGAFVAFYYLGPPLFVCSDGYWHLAAGNLLLNAPEFPRSDPWSYTAGQTPWYNISWGYDMLISLVHNAFGDAGILYLKLAISALAASIVFKSCFARKVSVEAALMVCILAVLVIYLHILARPQVVSILMIPLFHYIVHQSQERHNLIFFVPLLVALWVNMHGGVIVGFSILGAYMVDAYLSRQKKFLGNLILVSILSLATMLLNPYGVQIFTAIYQTLDSQMSKFIIEWQPLRMFIYIGATVYFMVFILATNVRDKKIPVADKILAFAWLAMGLISTRNFLIFVLVSAPYLALSINSFRHEKNKSFARACFDKARAMPALILCSLVLAGFIWITSISDNKERVHVNNGVAEGVQFLAKNYPLVRLLNFYDYGGEVIYRSKGKIRVFIDGRAETAYPGEIISDYIDFVMQEGDQRDIIGAYGINGALLSKKDLMFSTFKSLPGWRMVWSKGEAAIFIKH